MTTHLIPIGNSRGIRIPKALIEQCGLEGEVELHVKDNQLMISPKRKAREGWAKMLKEAQKRGDLEMTDEEKDWLNAPATSFDEEDWTW
jgi:antitoxin MazE